MLRLPSVCFFCFLFFEKQFIAPERIELSIPDIVGYVYVFCSVLKKPYNFSHDLFKILDIY